ncbi:globoside alpha-1,3-N-acetylgalactosaminyltransferase 1-like isoform X2 [Labeo rohita]|uniref:Globoside alpha-1,3-N-acetylgalactosaminyltransferase 1-like isoform X2 n=1 Tax=Labeo rohita TaxID=84645 RepID=A0A498L8M1_LABRO|nr:globoside alpha-1,3-N-acetylgalactosaminyltransferase 1-like isoform X2 [Labeo rohita]
MERLEKLIESRLINEADYVFSLDVDTKFYGRWGSESLGRLIGVIHPGYYQASREQFPYERRPESQAFIPHAEGDYYYGGAVIGGLVKDVYEAAKTCREQLDIDAAKSIEAAWQEESHLNSVDSSMPETMLRQKFLIFLVLLGMDNVHVNKGSKWRGKPTQDVLQSQDIHSLVSSTNDDEAEELDNSHIFWCYEFGQKLGEGGFGYVHAGTRCKDGLKVLERPMPSMSLLSFVKLRRRLA